MASIKDLYELVHSLSKNEKKHVSLMIEALGGKGKERYKMAFKYINEQKSFSVAALKIGLKREVNGMSLTEANNYVYDFICKSLLSYKEKNKLGYTNKLILIESFINRKLYSVSHQLLQSLIPEIKEKASFATLLKAHELQEIITIFYQPVNADLSFRINFLKEREIAMDNAKQQVAFLHLQFKFFQLLKTVGSPRSKEHSKKYEVLWNDPLLHLPTSVIHYRNIKSFYMLKGAIMYALNIKGSEEYVRNELKTFRERFKGKNLAAGEVSLWDLLISLLANNPSIDWQETEYIKDRQLELESEIKIVSIHYGMRTKILILQLFHFIKAKKYQQGVNYFYEHIQPDKMKLWKEAPLSYMVLFMGARLLFLNGELSKALDFTLQIKTYEKSMRPYFLINYQFLNLFCHYKLGNTQLLESLINSITRVLRKFDTLYAPEKAVLSFLKHVNDVNKFEFYIQKLAKTLEPFYGDHFHTDFFEFGDLREWLKLKN